MKEKIINIRNILKIIISLFVIFTMIKSCSKAYTFDEFIEFTQQIKDANISAVFNHHADLILTYQNNIRNTINVNNYVSWVVDTQNTSTGYCRILIYSNPMNITTSSTNNGTITPGQNVSTSVVNISQNDGSVGTNSGLRVTSYTSARYFGLVETSSTITNWYQLKFNNFYNPAPKLKYTPFYDVNNLTINNIQDVYGQKLIWTVGCRLGKITNYYEISPSLLSYKLTNYKTNEEIPIELQFIDRETMNIKVSSITSIFKNQLYKLVITYDEQDMIYYYYMYDQKITLTTGQSITTNFSGDSDYSIQNQTNDLIKNQNNFTRQIIDALFVVDSGDVKEVIDNIVANTEIDNMGIYSGEKQILDILTGEPSDFVIRWDPAYYQGQIIIPSGDINFSAKLRETPELQTIISWARIIIGYAITSIICMEIWFTFCRILGIATSWYEQQSDEIDTVSEYTNDFYDSDTQILVRDVVRKRKGYVQTIRQRKDFNPRTKKR